MVLFQLLLFIGTLRKIILKSSLWMKMSKDCWECLNSHSCAQIEAEFWASIFLYFHMCDAVSLPAWEVKTEFLPQGKRVVHLQIWSQYCKSKVERDRLHQYTMDWSWAKRMALLTANENRFRLIIYALYLHVKDAGCSDLLFFIQIRRQSHAGSWSHRWENVVNPCCTGLFEQKSKIGFLKISAIYFHLWTPAEHLTLLALRARKLWEQSLLMFVTLLFDTNMNMYITKPQWIKATKAVQFIS